MVMGRHWAATYIFHLGQIQLRRYKLTERAILVDPGAKSGDDHPHF